MIIELDDKDLDTVCGGSYLGKSVFLNFDTDPDTHCQLFLSNPNVATIETYVSIGNPGGQTIMGGITSSAPVLE